MTDDRCTLVCIADDATSDAVAATTRSVTSAASGTTDVAVEVVPSFERAAAAMQAATGWVGLIDPGATVDGDAFAVLTPGLRDPEADLLYTDERWVRPDGTIEPFHKPAWSPDRLRCQPYLGRLSFARADTVRAVGGLRAALGSCAEHDLWLRVGEVARDVLHVASTCCTRPATQPYLGFDVRALERVVDLTDEHLRRIGMHARARRHERVPDLLRLEPDGLGEPLVSIIVPTAGTARAVRGVETTLISNCVRSIVERSTYDRIEIVCVVDPSVDAPMRTELSELAPGRVRFVDFDEAFNFSRKVNRGVLAATGDVVVVLNDDTEVRSPGWIEAMLVYALHEAVGVVGARLHFDDGRVQHAGVVGVGGNPGHAYYGEPGDLRGHGGNALVPGDFLAVTGACLMTRRDVFLEVGGMSESFPSNYNDLDFCLKAGHAGYRVVATPDAVLDHYESSSRDGSVSTDELERIRRRWGRLLRDDPYYNPSFRTGIADFVA